MKERGASACLRRFSRILNVKDSPLIRAVNRSKDVKCGSSTNPGECAIHRVVRERLPPAALAKAPNMDKLLSYISQHRTTLFEWEADRFAAQNLSLMPQVAY
jgi:hypothetical protein